MISRESFTPLTELDGRLIKGSGDFKTLPSTNDFAEANGVMFTCPHCGEHQVLVWFVGVPVEVSPGPGRWTASGTGLSDLTLKPSVDIRPLLKATPSCGWHGFVTDGWAAK